MAAFRWVHSVSTTSGSATKVFWELICPANTRCKPLEMAISLKGTSVTDAPIQFELNLVATAGVTPTDGTKTNLDRDNGLTALVTMNDVWAGAEPVAGAILKSWNIHPQTGIIYPVPTDEQLIFSVTDSLGYMLRSVSPSVDVNVQIYTVIEE